MTREAVLNETPARRATSSRRARLTFMGQAWVTGWVAPFAPSRYVPGGGDRLTDRAPAGLGATVYHALAGGWGAGRGEAARHISVDVPRRRRRARRHPPT